MAMISKFGLARKGPSDTAPTTVGEARQRLTEAGTRVDDLVGDWAGRTEKISFKEFEAALKVEIWSFARAAMTLLLVLRECRVREELTPRVERAGRIFRVAPAIERGLSTIFGVVRYSRTYLREVAGTDRHGMFPLDAELGLPTDRFSWNLLSMSARLATKLSFAEAREVLGMFVPSAPSTEVIEQTVLGLGRFTSGWFEQAPAPQDDGDVLIIMIDGKGAPTATEEELKKRRGRRKKRRGPPSPRHRGRAARKRRPKKARPKKGDKSKNAKMATMVVMYTLKPHGKKLLGPFNRRLYASFAPKRHAFEIAQREANKRGFTPSSGKLIQVVTDGDDDLALYTSEFFPEAIHTIDVFHVIEKLWEAGACLHREGTHELKKWVEDKKDHLYRGRADKILDELYDHLETTPKSGPGNKGKRERLTSVFQYLDKRLEKLNYKKLRALDLEIGSGQVEGAVKHVIAKRCDHGGMRWIKERVEAVLQLRCIEINGDWDEFTQYAHDQMQAQADSRGSQLRLQRREPIPLPSIKKAA